MNVSELCIRRPVMTTIVMAAITVFGALAYRLLPVSDLPNVDFPTIQVSAALPGASPATMASTVATPLEKEFSTIAGVDSMTSSSQLGSTQITLQFALDRNIDGAAQDVQAAITRSVKRLPPTMPTPPSYQKVNPADQPVLFLAVTSPTLPLSVVDEYAETLMSQRISMVSGVAQVVVNGAQKYAVRIQLDPRELAARGLGIDEIATAVNDLNVNLPTGVMQGPERALTVESSGQLNSASEYRPAIVAWRGGNPVRLEELGRVFDSVENDKTAAWFNDHRGIILSIQRQPGTNTVAVVDAVKELVPAFRAALPASIDVDILYDRSESIRASVNDVRFTLLLTLVLVMAVIFVFLGSLRATVIPSLAMPLSILGAFAVMYLAGYSLDNFSLLALTLSVGFVVDDAIVVLENIVRHRELGATPFDAAVIGSKQISFTVLSMTLSLVAVFLPVLFLGGLVGRLLHEFSVTIAAAILVSGFVSLTLTPMMASRFLRVVHERDGAVDDGSAADGSPSKRVDQKGRFAAFVERTFGSLVAFYGRTLSRVLRHPWLTVAFSLTVLAATVWLFNASPKGFLPSEDTGRIFVQTEAIEGTAFPTMVRYQQAAAAIVAADPDIESFMSSIGARGGNATGVNVGTLFIKLRDRSVRKLSVEQIIARLRPKLAAVVGLRTYPQNLPTIRIGGQVTKSLYQYTLQASDTDVLYHDSLALTDKLAALPGFLDVTTDLQLKVPEVKIDIDRDHAAALGITPQAIELALGSSFGTRQISTIYAPTNSFQVILELAPEFQSDPAWLSQLYVRSKDGRLVSLTTVASVSTSVGPQTVNHAGQLPAVTVSFNLAPGTSLSQAVIEIDRLARSTLAPTITGRFQGAAQVFQSSQEGLGVLLILAVLVMYLILGILYESFVHPLTILTALPFAGFGALATLWIFHIELSLYGFVGLVLLVGLVKKNGIMMVDFAVDTQREHGKTALAAIHEACMVRFRPITMTTMAALLGTLPIALGAGAGSEARRPLGLAVVGGLLFSQLVTLYVTPVFYVLFDRLQNLGRKHATQPVEATHVDGGSKFGSATTQ